MSQTLTYGDFCSAFGQGEACARRGGYRSENPYAYEGELWQAWLAGFEHEEGPAFVVPERGNA